MVDSNSPSHIDPPIVNEETSNTPVGDQPVSGDPETLPPIPFKNLFRFANVTDKLLMVIGLLGSAAFGSGMPLMTVLFGDITEQFNLYYGKTLILLPGDPLLISERKSLENAIVLNILYFVGLGAAIFVCSYLSKAFWMASGERQAKRIREQFLISVLRQDMSFFDKMGAGDITTRLTSDVALIQDGISEKVSLTAQYIFTFIAAFVIAFIKGWKLTLVLCSAVPLLAASGAFMAKMVGDATNKSQASYASAGSIAQEALAYVRTVVAFGGEERLSQDYERKLIGAYQVNVKKAFYSGLGLGLLMLFMFSTYSLAFWFGSTLIRQGEYTGGTVITVFFSVIIGAFTLGNAGPNVQVIATACGAASKVFNIIERIPTIDTLSNNGKKVDKLNGNIEFRNISFAYPSRPDVPILKNFSLTINAGETVALVGESGSGKSTIVQLLERFYDPIQGDVLVDGINIKEYHLNSYRQCLGIVSQEPVLFATTIHENISLGAREGIQVTTDQIIEACELSNAAKFISKLPDGYNTHVGERGALLSGGQKQRVAIARAVISQCKILLLDEATSALDTDSEKIVQVALDRASEGRTTITIAHRLSTIRNANKIVVMRKGEIVEMGTHTELLANQGYYAELVQAQEVRTKKTDDNMDSPVIHDVDEINIAGYHNHLDASGNRSTILEINSEDNKKKSIDEIHPLHNLKKSYDKLDTNEPLSSENDKRKSLNNNEDDNDPEVITENTDVNMIRLFSMQKPEFGIIAIGIIAAALNGAHMPLFAIFFSRILTVFGDPDKDRMQNDANFWALMFLMLAIACFFIQLFQHSSFGIAGERLTMRIRKLSFRAMLRQNIGWFDDKTNGTGALCHQLSDEADRIQGLTGVFAGQIVQVCVTMAAGLIIAFVYSWKLTLLILACVPFMAAAGALQMKVLSGSGNEIKKAYSRAAQLTVDALSNIRTVHALARQDYFYKQYTNEIILPHNISIRKAWLGNIGAGFADGVVFWVYGAAFYALYRLVFDDGLNVGDGFTAMYSIVFAAMGTGQLSALGPNAAKAKIAAVGFFALIDRIPPIDTTLTNGEQRTSIDGQVGLTEVHFAYPTRPDAPILKGLSAQLPSGKKIALAGASGGGKSTIIGLLQRWYDTSSGQVSVDGINVPQWNLINLRSHMALVGQEPQLFSMSILDNIRFSKPDATLDEVKKAAEMANIDKFIDTLPNKYDTMITGTQVSGGQRQRICIARAIIRNPRIMLLDEATSALDSNSEKVVQLAIDTASIGRTTIIIAHRLSTIQDADVILCMKDGIIEEQGTHDELYARNGLYTQLVNNQKLQGTS